tara:strand:+ start:332 stop:724 length:393 start_codon:yes stop_codon:yes gene_type:complete
MKLKRAQKIAAKVLPKIEEFYGFSKYWNTTPYLEFEKSIYAKLMDEPNVEKNDGEQNPKAEFDLSENVISIYYPEIKNKKDLIQTLIHEYQHYLQCPAWFGRYYKMGYNYNDHPYEVQANNEEKNWKLFK